MKAENDETSRLLSELDTAIDQSSLLCDILNRRKQLRSIERVTGPSRHTRLLRQEIELLENRLSFARAQLNP